MGNPLSGTEGDCPVFMDRHGMKRQQTEEAIWMSVFVWIVADPARTKRPLPDMEIL